MSRLSIIIVNYKTPQLVIDCLRSVFAYPGDLEVIVVDNDSRDNSRELVLAHFPQVRWVPMSYNAGFARANNEGICVSTGEIVLLLNSDTINIDNAIGRCFDRFVDSPYIACGVQLLNRDGSPQISGNYFMKGSLNNLLPLPYIGALLKWLGTIIGVNRPHASGKAELTEVDWINGAFLMVKKEAIKQAGLMDEDFFLYAEEAEWCYRLRRYGRMVIYGDCNVVHLQGESSKEAFQSGVEGYYHLYDRKGLQIMLSNFVRIRKQHGLGWLLTHLLIYTFTIPVYFFAQWLHALLTLDIRKVNLRHWAGFSANVLRIWRYLPVIALNRPYFYKVL